MRGWSSKREDMEEKGGREVRDRRDETGLVLIRSLQSGMGFAFAFPISANLSD